MLSNHIKLVVEAQKRNVKRLTAGWAAAGLVPIDQDVGERATKVLDSLLSRFSEAGGPDMYCSICKMPGH